MDPTVLAIFGPTAVGKTAVAAALAARLRRAGRDPIAVSADALQVYRGVEILTGAADAIAGAATLEHRLIGCLSLSESCSVGAFAARAHAEIDAIIADGGVPIVVGGTGLYLRAALADLDLMPPPPPGRREYWMTALNRRGFADLYAELADRAPQTAARITTGDQRRLVRALELLDAGISEPLRGGGQLWTERTRHRTCLIGLTRPRAELFTRIDARIDAMLAAGVRAEVAAADAAGASQAVRQALGFKELLRDDVETMRVRSRRYAKRQLTWMRKLAGIKVIDIAGRKADDVAAEILKRAAIADSAT